MITMIATRYVRIWTLSLVIASALQHLAWDDQMFAQNIGTGGTGRDPSSSGFGAPDPVHKSLRATEELGDLFREQQHRFQPRSDHRQMRPKRPEPGEVEVTREENLVIPRDPLGSTLQSIRPRTP